MVGRFKVEKGGLYMGVSRDLGLRKHGFRLEIFLGSPHMWLGYFGGIFITGRGTCSPLCLKGVATARFARWLLSPLPSMWWH